MPANPPPSFGETSRIGMPDSTFGISNEASQPGLPLNFTSNTSPDVSHISADGSIIACSMTSVSCGEFFIGCGRMITNSFHSESPATDFTVKRKVLVSTFICKSSTNAPLAYTFVCLPLINAFASGRVQAAIR